MKVTAELNVTITVTFDVDLNSHMPIIDQAQDVLTDGLSTNLSPSGIIVNEVREVS